MKVYKIKCNFVKYTKMYYFINYIIENSAYFLNAIFKQVFKFWRKRIFSIFCLIIFFNSCDGFLIICLIFNKICFIFRLLKIEVNL